MNEDGNKANSVDPVDGLVHEISMILDELKDAKSRTVVDALVCYAKTKVRDITEVARPLDDKTKHRYDVLTADGSVVLGVPLKKEQIDFLNNTEDDKIVILRELDSNGNIIWENLSSSVFSFKEDNHVAGGYGSTDEWKFVGFEKLTPGEKINNPLIPMMDRESFLKADKTRNEKFKAELDSEQKKPLDDKPKHPSKPRKSKTRKAKDDKK